MALTRPVYRTRYLSLLVVAYVIVGAFVAGARHYFDNVHDLKAILTALLAILLWPLVLLGVNLHV